MSNKRWLQWLAPGMKLKRWIFVSLLGIVMLLSGLLLSFDDKTVAGVKKLAESADKMIVRLVGSPDPMPARKTLGVELMLFGLFVYVLGTTFAIRSIARAVNPKVSTNLADHVLKTYALAQGPKIVVIGGGTGLSTLLRGVKQLTSNITAIVTVTDDGGSSGSLRQDLNIPPPGDIRNCLVALADAEPALSALFQYRFEQMPQLKGHAFGNIFIAAMMGITGDFESAVRKTSEVLAIRGRVLPSTNKQVLLKAEMEDGTIIEGETNIVDSPLRIRKVYLSEPDADPPAEAIQAIKNADAILLGPGSVYTSVIPNLLVRRIAEHINRAKAARVYICNVMTQPGETDNYAASDHVKAIEAHVGKRIFDYVLLNKQIPNAQLVAKYRQSGQALVTHDTDRIRAMGYKPIVANLISETDVVRHDHNRLAEAIAKLLKQSK